MVTPQRREKTASWLKENTEFLNSKSSYLPKIPQKPEVALFSLFGEMISEIISN